MIDLLLPDALLLRPLSHPKQRQWQVGGRALQTELDLILNTRVDDSRSFSSLRGWAHQLQQSTAGATEARELEELIGGAESSSEWTDEARFGTDAVVLAVMRRISRESVYTARIIDRGAQLLNRALASRTTMNGVRRVWVPDVDRLDRPTLKVLTRAALLLEPHSPFAWCWQSTTDPRERTSSTGDLYVNSRSELLHLLAGVVAPHFEVCGSGSTLMRPEAKETSLRELAEALVLQNYDAVFAGAEELVAGGDAVEAAEALRLEGIAAVNVGRHCEADERFAKAESLVPNAARKAHLAYLRGLTAAKRRYRLDEARGHYQRGLAWLDGAAADGQDLALERAWLLNGLAFDRAIRTRLETGAGHLEAAFSFVQEAFDLVRLGTDSSRAYLRFNLIANSALLLEMSGRPEQAAEVFRHAFGVDLEENAARQRRFGATLGYRIGLLLRSAGRPAEAFPLLERAAMSEAVAGSWPTEERALRAVAAVALELNWIEEAETACSRGLELARSGRSAEGAIRHTLGLASCLVRRGQSSRAAELFEELRDDEGLPLDVRQVPSLASEWRRLLPSPPSPKLPPYLPEIDLEEIPRIDMNRFLTRVEDPQRVQATLGGEE